MTAAIAAAAAPTPIVPARVDMSRAVKLVFTSVSLLLVVRVGRGGASAASGSSNLSRSRAAGDRVDRRARVPGDLDTHARLALERRRQAEAMADEEAEPVVRRRDLHVDRITDGSRRLDAHADRVSELGRRRLGFDRR